MMKNWLFALSGLVRARRAERAAQERHGGELRLEVGQVGSALARALGIAALGHEAGNHAMESQPVVKAAADQGLDALDMMRREVGPQHDLDRAAVRQIEEQVVRRIGRNFGRRDDARHGGGAGAGAAAISERHERQREQALTNMSLPKLRRMCTPDAADLT